MDSYTEQNWITPDDYCEMILHEAEEKEQRHRVRVEECGKWYGSQISARTGQKYGARRFCGDFRNCPTCRKRKAEEMQHYLYEALDDEKPVRVSFMSEEAAANLGDDHGLKKADYLKIPQKPDEDGTSKVLVFHTDQAIEGYALSREEIETLDWDQYLQTRKGKNISGNLGKTVKATDEPEEDEVQICTKAIETKGVTPEQDKRAWHAAVAETMLEPKTVEEVEQAIARRVQLYVTKLVEQGVPRENIVVTNRRVYEKLSVIHWRYTEISEEETAFATAYHQINRESSQGSA